MWPLWPVHCDRAARGPLAQVAMAMTLEGLSQTHWSTGTLAHTLRQGERSIFYYTEEGVGGAARVAVQWAHCRDTGEISEGGECVCQWQKMCMRVWLSTGHDGSLETVVWERWWCFQKGVSSLFSLISEWNRVPTAASLELITEAARLSPLGTSADLLRWISGLCIKSFAVLRRMSDGPGGAFPRTAADASSHVWLTSSALQINRGAPMLCVKWIM